MIHEAQSSTVFELVDEDHRKGAMDLVALAQARLRTMLSESETRVQDQLEALAKGLERGD